MDVYLLSDLHTELWKNKLDPEWFKTIRNTSSSSLCSSPISSLLILAGDVGIAMDPIASKYYQAALIKASLNFDQVLLVAGNHEYNSNNTRAQVDTYLRELTGKIADNISFLQKDIFETDSHIFLGATLWSQPHTLAATCLRDSWLPAEERLALHLDHSKWFKRNLRNFQHDERKIISISHHPPTKRIIQKYDMFSDYYGSNNDQLITMSDVWACGHLHHANHLSIGSSQLVLNPVGYLSDRNMPRSVLL